MREIIIVTVLGCLAMLLRMTPTALRVEFERSEAAKADRNLSYENYKARATAERNRQLEANLQTHVATCSVHVTIEPRR
jgi:predicted Co/Zn/Cd cation transporter (cation efflux family)